MDSLAPAALSRPPPLTPELPLTVQLASASVPRWYRPPPDRALPWVIVRPRIDAVTFASTWNTRPASLPLRDSRFAPGPVIVVRAAVPVSSSGPPVRVIVLGVAKTLGSKRIVSP